MPVAKSARAWIGAGGGQKRQHTAGTSVARDGVLGRGLLAGALKGGILAAGALGFSSAGATIAGAAAAGLWCGARSHCELA